MEVDTYQRCSLSSIHTRTRVRSNLLDILYLLLGLLYCVWMISIPLLKYIKYELLYKYELLMLQSLIITLFSVYMSWIEFDASTRKFIRKGWEDGCTMWALNHACPKNGLNVEWWRRRWVVFLILWCIWQKQDLVSQAIFCVLMDYLVACKTGL